MIAPQTITTAEEFEQICGQMGPCELVRGEIVPMSPSGQRQSQVCANITYLFSAWARRTKLGRVLTNEAGFVTQTNPDTVRGADVAYISFARQSRDLNTVGFSRTAPDLVVEVVGEGQTWKHMLEKAGEYFAMGVARVLIVYPDRQHVFILYPDREPLKLTEKDSFPADPLLPGFACKISEFFE